MIENNNCTKVLLANAMGVRMMYCKGCDVVELEIGAISIRLSPETIQRIANVMMKASLKLDNFYNAKEAQPRVEPLRLH
jgi:hypothetical protein